MAESRLRLVALLAAASWLFAFPAAAQSSPCVSGGDRGFGGTGLQARGDRGFGGTGLDEGGDRGFGGTGLSAGIYGTVTGFGSLCVNGLEIEYDAKTRVERAGRSIGADELARGQTVTVDALWRDGAWQAERIVVQPLLSGPVTAVDAAAGRLEIMGTPVEVADEAAALRVDRIRPGDPVSVHGLRASSGRLVATRLEAGAEGAPAAVVGRARRTSSDVLLVGGTPVLGAPLEGERSVRVTGVWSADRGALVASEVRPAVEFAPGTVVASIEALVDRAADERFETALFTIDVTRIPEATAAEGPETRVWAEGRLEAGDVLEADRIFIDPLGGGLPEPLEGLDREGLLQGLGDGAAALIRLGGAGPEGDDAHLEHSGDEDEEPDAGRSGREPDDSEDEDDDGGIFGPGVAYDPRDFLEAPHVVYGRRESGPDVDRERDDVGDHAGREDRGHEDGEGDALEGFEENEGLEGIEEIEGIEGIEGIEEIEGIEGIEGIEEIDGLEELEGLDGLEDELEEIEIDD